MTSDDIECEVGAGGAALSRVAAAAPPTSLASPAIPGFDMVVAANFADATKLALISVDPRGRIRFVNRAAASLFGYARDEMIGQPVEIIIPERLRSSHARGFVRAMAGEELNLGGKAVEVYAVRRNGSEFPIELTLCAWHDGREMGAGAVIRDITERRERDSRLLRLASQDQLTGLHNRSRFTEILEGEMMAGGRSTVVMIDIDGFRDVNDVHGHVTGDSLLQSVAVRLPHSLPANAEVARFGGDEFAVLLPGVDDRRAAMAFAQAILESFARPFEVDGQVLDLGASIGIAIAAVDGGDADEVVASADLALANAKSGGRSARMYEPEMRSEANERRALRDQLLQALRARQLVLHFQPQVDIRSRTIFGVEALIRWQHPEKGMLMPGTFLPALAQSALALEIGWWTLDEACRVASLLNASSTRSIRMGVNLFPEQLQAPILCKKVSQALDRHGLAAELLELEITETIALHDDDKSLDAMNMLREIGVGIAFDDFGTGYASLSSLQRYPLTKLKIDRGFVSELATKPRDAAITRALIAMSLEMGLETIAEGIETQEQEEFLLSLGCPSAQGYRYGKPMAFEVLKDYLREI
ncbi:diguanylate cyclase [Rhizobium anhuiense]|uniref:Diguanylate cyclase n=1 Tax=Rhizobium anhuiense TaxID=1184720 RepID=A0ABX4IYS8_9HYPH|nr:EAL domain-containing protein [Rhizobium anhuiense]PDS40488.1 diguanylate cyclase [Rhizobium anhuiense]PDS47371.1 diguanylate cyclase [Rhizobium anhuiense]